MSAGPISGLHEGTASIGSRRKLLQEICLWGETGNLVEAMAGVS